MEFPRSLTARKVTTVTLGFVLLACSALCGAQSAPQTQSQEAQFPTELSKYPGLLAELANLVTRMRDEITFPPDRSQSRLLSMMPKSTTAYVALPNYGDASHQAIKIFRGELQASPVLRDWWEHNVGLADGLKAEDLLDKFYELSQFLGDEIALSGGVNSEKPNLILVAEVRKPGLQNLLQKLVSEMPTNSKSGLRILSPQDLRTAQDMPDQPLILVRPDFVIAAIDLVGLKAFNDRLDSNDQTFTSTAFGQRLAQAYSGGASIVGALNMQALIDQVPASTAQFKSVLQQTGFEDVKYLVWDHKTVASQSISQAELSFDHPRHGVAAWLAPPRSLGSLDFVSPKPLMAFSIVLSNPQKIFTDIKDLLTAANPNALAMLTQSEQMLGVSLEDDFLKNLDGEITVEISGAQAEQPGWKVILRTSDSAHLQQALTKLLSSANMRARSSVVDGTTYYYIRVPSRTGPAEISYSFVNGYLVLASSHAALAEALALNQTGNSLGKSKQFLASLPPGHSSTVSALFYEDPVALMSLRMTQVAPESAGLFASLMGGERKPLVICAYGEESAISEASSSATFDPAAVMIGAAIAIPNLLRARIAANESSAAGAVRTIDTAQITYSVAYPRRRYAPDLAALGPDPSGAGGPSPAHASLLDTTLANSGCTAVNWCIKNGFRFKVTGICKLNFCADFVALGTPLASNTGSRSFCSTSDGVVRAKVGPPLTAPIDIPECRSWQPLR